MDRDQVPEAQLSGEALGAAERLCGEGREVVDRAQDVPSQRGFRSGSARTFESIAPRGDRHLPPA